MHAAVLRYSAAKQERATCLEFESPVEHGNLDHVTGDLLVFIEKKKKAMAKSLVGVMIFFGINKGVRDKLYLEAGPRSSPPIGLERERVFRDR